MLQTAMGLGLVFSFLFVELAGISPGGLVVPGYLAIYWDNPLRLCATLAIAFLSFLCLRFLANHLILFGRRRFMAAILLSFILAWTLDLVLLKHFHSMGDFRVIGFVIPGLIANDMFKQGVLATILSVIFVSGLVHLVLLAVL